MTFNNQIWNEILGFLELYFPRTRGHKITSITNIFIDEKVGPNKFSRPSFYNLLWNKIWNSAIKVLLTPFYPIWCFQSGYLCVEDLIFSNTVVWYWMVTQSPCQHFNMYELLKSLEGTLFIFLIRIFPPNIHKFLFSSNIK